MKLKLLAFLFTLLVIFNFSECFNNKLEITMDSNMYSNSRMLSLVKEKFAAQNKNKNTNRLEKAPEAPTISDTYFLQKLYPGKEPIRYLETSSAKMLIKYFVVQGSTFYYGQDTLRRSIIEGNTIS